MSSFQTKAPSTYRKKYPGRYVVAVLFVTPTDTDMLVEMAVEKDLFEKIQKLCVDEMRAKAAEDFSTSKGKAEQ